MDIEERLEAMQKELDAWKRFTCWMLVPLVLIVAGAVAWGGFMGKPVQAEGGKEIRAESFVVVDEQGRERAILGLTSTGSPLLAVHDAEGGVPIALGLDPSGMARLNMTCQQGESRLFLGTTVNGTSALGIEDAQGIIRAAFGLNPDGSPMLWMSDSQGNPRTSLSVNPSGSPGVVLKDAQGAPRAVLAFEAVHDEPGLSLFSQSGKARVLLLVDNDGPAFSLRDKKGNQRWFTPSSIE